MRLDHVCVPFDFPFPAHHRSTSHRPLTGSCHPAGRRFSLRGMATITKSKKPARKPVRPARAAKPAKLLPYGITPRALPAGVAVAGDFRAAGAEFGKGVDLSLVESAYKSRSL